MLERLWFIRILCKVEQLSNQRARWILIKNDTWGKSVLSPIFGWFLFVILVLSFRVGSEPIHLIGANFWRMLGSLKAALTRSTISQIDPLVCFDLDISTALGGVTVSNDRFHPDKFPLWVFHTPFKKYIVCAWDSPCVRIVVASKINFRGTKNESKIHQRI